jgi:hypothetical protein
MKKIYTFTVNKIEEIEEKVESVNESGAKVITINKVKKPVPHKFAVVKLSRSLRDESDLFYGSEYGKAVQKGMIPSAILSKRFENDDGIFSEKTVERVKELSSKYIDAAKKQAELSIKTEKTEEETKSIESLELEIKKIHEELREIETRKNLYFSNTAEVWARNRTVIWLVLFLSYIEKPDGSLEPFFKGDDFKTKMLEYDKYNDNEDQFIFDTITTFISVVSLYYATGVTDQAEIEKMLVELNDTSRSIQS